MKIIELLKVSELEIFPSEIQIFSKPLFHLFKWKKSCHLLSRVLYSKIIWIHGDHKCKMKVWESPFIPSQLTFKEKFRISLTFSQSITQQSNNQSKLSIYHNIPKFRILGCYMALTAGTAPRWRKSGFPSDALKIFRWMSSWRHRWRKRTLDLWHPKILTLF